MKKSNLEAGQRVVLANGYQMVVHTDLVVNSHGFQKQAFFDNEGHYFVGSRYNEDLSRIDPPFSSKYDIVEVYGKPAEPRQLMDSTKRGALLWRRETVVTIPLKEAVELLKKNFPPYTTVKIGL